MDKATEILKRVRRIELRAKHLATENFAGQYQSGFRGQGLDFDDFREYLAGDDPRFIDWKVTARMNTPYVRRFKEEREQAIILAVDVSGSMHYASSVANVSKLDYAAEIAAVLAFSAAQAGDKCGLLLYGMEKPLYVPPAKGFKQTLRIVREIVAAEPGGHDQSLNETAEILIRTQKKAAIVLMISDFWGEPDRAALGKLNFKHELIPVRIVDPLELNLPNAGRVVLKDPESQEPMYFNLNKDEIRAAHAQAVSMHRNKWKKEFRRAGIDFLDLKTADPYIPELKNLFSRRSKKFSH